MTVNNYQLDMNKILLSAMVGLLTWNVWTTHNLAISVALLDQKVESLEESVTAKIAVLERTNEQPISYP